MTDRKTRIRRVFGPEFWPTLGHWFQPALWPLLAACTLYLVFLQPNTPKGVAWSAFRDVPQELPIILMALIAMGNRAVGRIFRVLLVSLLTLIAAFKAADLGMFMALSRGFNPVGDLPLIVSFYQLLIGAIGPIATVLAGVGAGLVIIGLAAILWWSTGVWARLTRPRSVALGAGAFAVCLGGFTVLEVRGDLSFSVPGRAKTTNLVMHRYTMAQDTIAKLRSFRTAASGDPLANQTGLFDAVDRDVFVIFIESYGRTSFDTPLHADHHLPTLQAAETRLSDLGLSLASTFLKAPTQGGQSWLSHASFANGLWIDNQNSYRAVLGSGRKTLFHLAKDAGFHTAAVMPQITLDWPESSTMGFDTILAAKDLGYQGPAFNWVTMPDQFTYLAMDRLLGDVKDPLFVQVATGSSHAPWVPVPELLEWDEVGDGTVYGPVVEGSDPPAVVWKDYDRVRRQYRAAIDYALQTVFSYAERRAEDPPLFIIIGDHQAAGFIARDERPDVPMHVIGPKHLVNKIADADFTPGLIPAKDTKLRPMSDLREHLVRSLTSVQIAGQPQ